MADSTLNNTFKALDNRTTNREREKETTIRIHRVFHDVWYYQTGDYRKNTSEKNDKAFCSRPRFRESQISSGRCRLSICNRAHLLAKCTCVLDKFENSIFFENKLETKNLCFSSLTYSLT